MKSFKIVFLSILALSILTISSCKKSEGDGGKATITGKVWIKRYIDPTGTLITMSGEYAGAYEDVYIIYGDDATFGAKVKTNPDGVYEFNYLRTGKYTIYAYSSGLTVTPSNRVAVIKEVEITKKTQTVECEIINLAK